MPGTGQRSRKWKCLRFCPDCSNTVMENIFCLMNNEVHCLHVSPSHAAIQHLFWCEDPTVPMLPFKLFQSMHFF